MQTSTLSLDVRLCPAPGVREVGCAYFSSSNHCVVLSVGMRQEMGCLCAAETLITGTGNKTCFPHTPAARSILGDGHVQMCDALLAF